MKVITKSVIKQIGLMRSHINAKMSVITWMAALSLLLHFQAYSQQDSLNFFDASKDTSTRAMLFKKFSEAKKSDSMLVYMNIFLKEYPKALNEWKYRPDAIYGALISKFAAEKKWPQYDFYLLKTSLDGQITSDYFAASDLFKAGEDLSRSEMMILRALKKYEDKNKDSLIQILSDSSKSELQEKYHYAYYMLLYAKLAYINKHFRQGMPYAKKAGEIMLNKGIQSYELYLKFLAKTAKPAVAIAAIEAHYRSGSIEDDELHGILRDLYVRIHKSSKNFDTYYNALSAYLIANAKERLIAKKVSLDAPDFNLLNLAGDTVNLKSLKGKTIVLDFWATWCGPCKRSFPGMQKLMNKYKTNDKVVFLFINTRENFPTEEKRRKEINDYLTSHKLHFNVLLDTKEDVKAADSYAVVESYKVEGIPTKIVIGPDGRINFIDVGYSGSDEKLNIDLSSMINLTL